MITLCHQLITMQLWCNQMKSRIGVYEKAIPPTESWFLMFSTAKKLGFDFFELSIDESASRIERLDWDDRQIRVYRDAMIESGLYTQSLCLSAHRKYSLGSENESTRNVAWSIMEKSINLADKLGIRVIQLAGYDVYYEESTEKSVNLFINNLSRASQLAANYGITLGVEVMDIELTKSVENTLKLINRISSPWLKVYPDMGNIAAMGADIYKDLISGAGNYPCIHLKDAKPGLFRGVAFGEGVTDFKAGFKALCDCRYQGPFVIEMWHEMSNKPLEELANAKLWLESIMSNTQSGDTYDSR